MLSHLSRPNPDVESTAVSRATSSIIGWERKKKKFFAAYLRKEIRPGAAGVQTCTLLTRTYTHAVVSARLWNADQPVWFIQSSAGATHDGLRLPRILFAPCIIGSTSTSATRADVLCLFLSLSLFLNKK